MDKEKLVLKKEWGENTNAFQQQYIRFLSDMLSTQAFQSVEHMSLISK